MPEKSSATSAPAKELLRQSGVTQTAVAQAVGVSMPTVSMMLDGKRNLSIDVAVACSRLSGIELATLFPGSSWRFTNAGASQSARSRKA